MKELFKNYEVHHKIVIFGFSMTFSLSCIMFELIIFEILGYLDTGYINLFKISVTKKIKLTKLNILIVQDFFIGNLVYIAFCSC
jgi:hypothetical protein